MRTAGPGARRSACGGETGIDIYIYIWHIRGRPKAINQYASRARAFALKHVLIDRINLRTPRRREGSAGSPRDSEGGGEEMRGMRGDCERLLIRLGKDWNTRVSIDDV